MIGHNLLKKKQFIKVLYVDFEKAFDKVSVQKLLHKLNGFGVTGNIFECIKSFLTNRRQSVRIASVQSSFQQVISGVPQGSVLGPFLFLLFINDLPDIFDNSVSAKLFADDLKAYDIFNTLEDGDKIQSALNNLIEWSNKWQLNLSVSKCGSLLVVGKSSFEDTHKLTVNGDTLNIFHSTKDLGVFIDSHLSFSEHISGIISKANQRIYLLLKTFRNRSIKLMIFAFKVYILPLLEYCSPVWSPFKLNDVDRIEKVQRSFTKKLEGLKTLTYSERLVACELPSLELRRLRADLLLCFKIVHNLIAIDFNDFFELEQSQYNTRGHKFKLRIPKIHNTLRKNFFSVRILPVWNYLSSEIVSSSCCASFKMQLLSVDLSKFLLRKYDSFD